jgi:hypothetical protein
VSDDHAATLDEIVDEIEPATVRVPICTRADLVGRLRELEESLEAALRADVRAQREDRVDYAAQAPGIAEEIEALEAHAREVSRVFVLRALGSRAYSDLLAEHPPTEQQRKTNPRLDHNPETLPAELIARCMVEPTGATAASVSKLRDKITHGQWQRLYGEALAVNVGELTVPFSARASAVLRASEQSSTT